MPKELIPMATVLDAARLHFAAVARSPGYTREARHEALRLERLAADELAAWNRLSDGDIVAALAA